MIEELILLSAGAYLLLASINDIKHRFVHDYTTYSFGALFLVLRLLLNDYGFISYAVPTLIISYALYKLGAWGGGDLKLLTALAIGIPYLSTDSGLPFFANFLTNTLIMGMIFGIAWSLMLIIKNLREVSKKITKIDLVIIIISFTAGLILLTQAVLLKLIAVILFFLPLTYLTKKVELVIQVIDKRVTDLEEGDWILNNIKIGRKLVTKKPTGLSKEDIKILQLSKLRKIKVRDGIPFVPSFFLGFLTAYYYGNIILNLVGNLITSI